MLDLKRRAREARDRRDTKVLRQLVAAIELYEPRSAWVEQQLTFCDAVDAVNRGKEFMAGKRLIANRARIPTRVLADDSVSAAELMRM